MPGQTHLLICPFGGLSHLAATLVRIGFNPLGRSPPPVSLEFSRVSTQTTRAGISPSCAHSPQEIFASNGSPGENMRPVTNRTPVFEMFWVMDSSGHGELVSRTKIGNEKGIRMEPRRSCPGGLAEVFGGGSNRRATW